MTELIDYIDNQISECIPNMYSWGLCHLIEDDSGIHPATLQTEAVHVSPDDKYSFQFYHRLLDGSPETDENLSFGRKPTRRNNQTIRTVIFQPLGTDLKFIDDFINALPDKLALNDSPAIYKMAYVGSSITLNRDSNAIWDDEFGESYKDKYQKIYNIYAVEWELNYIKCNLCI